MNLTRRTLLKGTVYVAAASSELARAAAAVLPTMPDVLRVFDARLPQSLAWRGLHAAGAIDVADEGANRWMRLRGVEGRGRVAGLTSWSDFVQARGVLQEKGRRLRVESRRGALFYWEMA